MYYVEISLLFDRVCDFNPLNMLVSMYGLVSLVHTITFSKLSTISWLPDLFVDVSLAVIGLTNENTDFSRYLKTLTLAADCGAWPHICDVWIVSRVYDLNHTSTESPWLIIFLYFRSKVSALNYSVTQFSLNLNRWLKYRCKDKCIITIWYIIKHWLVN